MSDQEAPHTDETTSPYVREDIASHILAGFKRGELPPWMTRTSYNSAVIKAGLVDGETVSITAPSQRLSEAKEGSNDAVLELLIKKSAGEDIDEATLDETRARASRAAIDYLAGVITEFGSAIKFERPLVVGDDVLFTTGDPIPPLSEVKDAAAREAIVKDHLAPGLYVQLMLGAKACPSRWSRSSWPPRETLNGTGVALRIRPQPRRARGLAGARRRAPSRRRVAAGGSPVPGGRNAPGTGGAVAGPTRPVHLPGLSTDGRRDHRHRLRPRRDAAPSPRSILEGVARMLGGKG